MSIFKRSRDDFQKLCHNDYLKLSHKYTYLSEHFSKNKFRKFEFTHDDSTYHLSKASLLEYYGIHLKLPCQCPIIISLNDDVTTNPQSIILWNPSLVSKCDIPTLPCSNNYTYKIVIPDNRYLSPCIPGRKLYLDTLISLIEISSDVQFNTNVIRLLDIGTGASAIYPLLGASEYGWNFVGSDIDESALDIARHNVYTNKLSSKIVLRKQNDCYNIYSGIIDSFEFFHFTLCNPPFYSYVDEQRTNINTHKMGNEKELVFTILNGQIIKIYQKYRNIDNIDQSDYLSYPNKTIIDKDVNKLISNDKGYLGGELAFITLMIMESRFYCKNVLWFTSLVSKKINLKKLKQMINNEMLQYCCMDLHLQNAQFNYLDNFSKRIKANYIKNSPCNSFDVKLSNFKIKEIRIFEIKPGQISRWILCWTFYTSEQRDHIIKTLHVH